MNGKTLLNNTLKVNAAFSLLSGLDFIFFDKTIAQILSGGDLGSFVPIGLMLVGFAAFVFIVSIRQAVNKYLVGSIIAMDALWVVGSVVIIATGYSLFTTIGLFLISLVGTIIGIFAYLQAKGLRLYLKDEMA